MNEILQTIMNRLHTYNIFPYPKVITNSDQIYLLYHGNDYELWHKTLKILEKLFKHDTNITIRHTDKFLPIIIIRKSENKT